MTGPATSNPRPDVRTDDAGSGHSAAQTRTPLKGV